MATINERYLKTLDILTATGRAERAEDADYPTDDELIAMTREAARQVGAVTLFTTIDPEILVDLRDAYNEGREPGLLDFGQVVTALAALGVEADIEQHGGTATLFAGPWHLPNADGVLRRAVSLGPGDGPGASGYTDQLSYGPATLPDQGENVNDHARPSEVAQGIADMIDRIFEG